MAPAVKNNFKIYITGLPGTGKSTVIGELQKKDLFAFDIEEIGGLCSWRDKITHERIDYHSGVGKDWIETNEWICDIEKLKCLLDKKQGTITCGGIAANQNEYLPLFDMVVLLRCDRKTLFKRLTARKGIDVYGKTLAEQNDILAMSDNFESHLIDLGAILIDTQAPVLATLDTIIAQIKNVS